MILKIVLSVGKLDTIFLCTDDIYVYKNAKFDNYSFSCYNYYKSVAEVYNEF